MRCWPWVSPDDESCRGVMDASFRIPAYCGALSGIGDGMSSRQPSQAGLLVQLLLPLLFSLFLVASCAASESMIASPVGLWRVFGDKSGQSEALVQISENRGLYEGRITTVFPRPGVPSNARCESCPGERRNQPLQGLLILTASRKTGKDDLEGEILDPEDGTIYRCTLRLLEDDRRLLVRGYVGITLFGRTQTWSRE